MDALNIVFGIITVLSFGYAIWVNREMKRMQELKDTIISEIKNSAVKIKQQTVGTNIEGYSDSIIRFCTSISDKDEIFADEIGRIRNYYFPFEIPPMQTRCGVVEDDKDAKLTKTLTGEIQNPNDEHFIYGPYKPLPLAGTYKALFRLRINNDVSKLEYDMNDVVAQIDVFDYHGGKKFLGIKDIKLSELANYYQRFEIHFEYKSITQALEYRISIRATGISISSDYILIERINKE